MTRQEDARIKKTLCCMLTAAVIPSQVTLQRAPRSSRPDVHSATPSALVSPTKSVPTFMAFLAAIRARPKGSRTPPPTSTKASPGTRQLSSSTSVCSLSIAYNPLPPHPWVLRTAEIRPQANVVVIALALVGWKAVGTNKITRREPQEVHPRY